VFPVRSELDFHILISVSSVSKVLVSSRHKLFCKVFKDDFMAKIREQYFVYIEKGKPV
jgi:hypothetical protein